MLAHFHSQHYGVRHIHNEQLPGGYKVRIFYCRTTCNNFFANAKHPHGLTAVLPRLPDGTLRQLTCFIDMTGWCHVRACHCNSQLFNCLHICALSVAIRAEDSAHVISQFVADRYEIFMPKWTKIVERRLTRLFVMRRTHATTTRLIRGSAVQRAPAWRRFYAGNHWSESWKRPRSHMATPSACRKRDAEGVE